MRSIKSRFYVKQQQQQQQQNYQKLQNQQTSALEVKQ